VFATAKHEFGFKADYLQPTGVARLLSSRFQFRCQLSRFQVLHNHVPVAPPSPFKERWEGMLVQHYHDPCNVKRMDCQAAFLSHPSMLKVIPKGRWIPLPVVIPDQPNATKPLGLLRIGYDQADWKTSVPSTVPAKMKLLPLEEIEEACAESKQLVKHPLDHVMPYSRMSEYYSGIDVWVDRVGLGSYGWMTAEALSYGVPVITQNGDDRVQLDV